MARPCHLGTVEEDLLDVFWTLTWIEAALVPTDFDSDENVEKSVVYLNHLGTVQEDLPDVVLNEETWIEAVQVPTDFDSDESGETV